MKAQAILIALGLAIVMVATSPCLAVETYVASKTVVQNYQLVEDRIVTVQVIKGDSSPDRYEMLEFIRSCKEKSIARMAELGTLSPQEAANAIARSRREAREFQEFMERAKIF